PLDVRRGLAEDDRVRDRLVEQVLARHDAKSRVRDGARVGPEEASLEPVARLAREVLPRGLLRRPRVPPERDRRGPAVGGHAEVASPVVVLVLEAVEAIAVGRGVELPVNDPIAEARALAILPLDRGAGDGAPRCVRDAARNGAGRPGGGLAEDV